MASCSTTKPSDESNRSEEQLQRGVRNPRVIDLITPLPPTDQADGARVELLMIEDRPWGSDPAQLDQLQDKLNNYLDYALDGFLAEQYPAYAGQRIQIALECVAEPTGPVQGLIEAVERYLASTGIGFRLVVK